MELLSLLKMGKDVIAWVVTQASILGAEGDITPEQLAQIKNAAGISDDKWDAEVEAAKERLAQLP